MADLQRAFHHGQCFGVDDFLPVSTLEGFGKFLSRRRFFLKEGTQLFKKTVFFGGGCFFCLWLVLHTSRQQLDLRRLLD